MAARRNGLDSEGRTAATISCTALQGLVVRGTQATHHSLATRRLRRFPVGPCVLCAGHDCPHPRVRQPHRLSGPVKRPVRCFGEFNSRPHRTNNLHDLLFWRIPHRLSGRGNRPGQAPRNRPRFVASARGVNSWQLQTDNLHDLLFWRIRVKSSGIWLLVSGAFDLRRPRPVAPLVHVRGPEAYIQRRPRCFEPDSRLVGAQRA